MKIRGRYIAVLAVLGLFLALVPLYTAGAVTGEVTLSGGEGKGQFFSDKCDNDTDCYNIITIEVEDIDLSPLRFGKGLAGLDEAGGTDSDGEFAVSGNDLALGDLVIQGEKEKVDKFDGGPSNPVCVDTEADGTAGDAGVGILDTVYTGLEAERPDECDPQGDAVLGAGLDGDFADNDSSDNATDEDDEAEDNTYTFTLKETARDANGDGVVDYKDFTVRVNNSVLKNDGSSSEPGYFAVEPANDNGLGVDEVVIHLKVPDVRDESVQITYEYSEYSFDDASTPLNIAGSRVFHGPHRQNLDEIGVDGVNSSNHTLRVAENVTADAAEVTFAYHVGDKPKKLVTVGSTTSQGANDVTLDGDETGVRTSVFRSTAALVSNNEYNLIVTATDDPDLNLAGDEKERADGSLEITVGELKESDDLDQDRIERLAAKLDITDDTDSKKFLARLLPVSHEDTITVTYADKDVSGDSTGSVVKTAEVDMEAPVVTLVRPTDKFYTKEETVTLQADVVDDGAGVERDDIVMTATSGVSLPGVQDQLKSPIGDGFSVTGVPTASIGEGTQKWAVLVTDKVGNTPDEDIDDADECTGTGADEVCGPGPVGVNEGARGAAAPNTLIGDVDNAFTFTVDTTAPKLQSGTTGLSLKNPGVASGDSRESENVNKREWVRVTFSLGTGGAPLDAATVEASDFRVDDAEPLDAMVNAAGQECDDNNKNCKIAKGSAVYLKVGKLDTDARPEVELTGEIKDRSGNVRSGGDVSALIDGLDPVLMVTISEDISDSEVVITVSSSERLSGRPMVKLTEEMPDNGTTEGLGNPLAVVLQPGGTTLWEATEDVTGNQAFKYYVVVEAKDPAGNDAKAGDDKPADDVISFQLDSQSPTVKFKTADDKDLDTSVAADKPEEGAVWIVMEFDEDEHADDKGKTTDKFRKVTVTDLTLTNLDTEDVVAEDVSAVFSGEVNCVDHDTDSDRYDADDPAANNKCATQTLAINLLPGMYNIEVTGVDSVGNDVTDDVDFEVTEAEPFELELRPGQNFVSIPGMPMGDGGNINTLLADEAISAISTYDRSRELQGESPWLRSTKDLETGMFSGDITAIEPGKAYFINSTASVTLEIQLQASDGLPPTIPVRQGYNAIGFWSLSGADDAEIDLYLGGIGWSVAYTYDPTPGKGWEVLRKGGTDPAGDPLSIEAGKGYLVYALYDSVLTP